MQTTTLPPSGWQYQIDVLAKLGNMVRQQPASLQLAMQQATAQNGWFDAANVQFALDAVAEAYLSEAALHTWLARYHAATVVPQKIALVMAGNLPLVGLHDLLCVWVCGHTAVVKLSAKDTPLMQWFITALRQLDPANAQRLQVVEMVAAFEAVIATGSDNSGRYFDYYFGRYPHIIRRNRSSVAVLTGSETADEMTVLGNDIFTYFGLGCRNVSQLLVPVGYDFTPLLAHLDTHFAHIQHHHKYRNNYDYHRSIYLLNQQFHYASDTLLLLPFEQVASPMAALHYHTYQHPADLQQHLSTHQAHIQCVVGQAYTPFGTAQKPSLSDYADGIDTLQWLLDLPQQQN